MAANAFNSVYHHHSLRQRHSIDCPRTTHTTYLFFLKPTAAAGQSLSHSAEFAVSPATSASSASASTSAAADSSVSFDVLKQHLSSGDFRQADEETRRLLIALAGEAAVKRGYVFFSEVQFIAAEDLRGIDALWREHSGGRFGYSVQKRIWEKANRDFTKFFIKVGWMKKLEGLEVVQYNYRSFPAEFMWEMPEESESATAGPPEGHLPLTNALRGTQLLSRILNHPAFEGEGEEDEKGQAFTAVAESTEEKGKEKGKGIIELMGGKGFKPNYTF